MIYSKTEMGQQVVKTRSVALTPRQRSAFILFDGKRTVDAVLAATAGMGLTLQDIAFMADSGLLAPVLTATSVAATGQARTLPLPEASTTAPPSPTAVSRSAADAGGVPAPERSARNNQQRYQDAYPIATQITANMGLRGFRLNLAVEGAGSYEKLLELSTKIRDAVGPEKFAKLDQALNG